jgi:hypothetical protein
MDTTTLNSADPKVHSQHIQEMPRDVGLSHTLNHAIFKGG